MGTTVTAAYLDEDAVAIAHVGDSRAYLLRDGELSRLTEDHSLVEELLRERQAHRGGGASSTRSARSSRGRSASSRSSRSTPGPTRCDPAMSCCSAATGSPTCSPSRRSQRVLLESPDLDAAADRLIDEANEAGGRDNITVVLFRVELAPRGEPADSDQPTMIARGRASSHDQRSPDGADGRAATDRPRREPRLARARRAGSRTCRPASSSRPEQRAPLRAARQDRRRARPRLVFVLFLIGAGGYLASRQLYFLGTNGQGTVVVYRGFPYVLPFGIPMYETFYVSGVPASSIPADRRGDAAQPRDARPDRRHQADQRPGARQDQRMRARNRELFGLIPASLLITAGFAAVFIQRSNQLSTVSLDLRRGVPRAVRRRRTSSSASRCRTPTRTSSRWWRCSPASGW